MKISKFNENISQPVNFEQLKEEIYNIINWEIETENYYGGTRISDISRKDATEKIAEYLIDNLTPEIMNEIRLKQDSKKYNL